MPHKNMMALPVTYFDEDACIVRKARVNWRCSGNGARSEGYKKFAAQCDQWILAGERYVEYVGETPSYQSGSRHCLLCANAFMKAEAKAVHLICANCGLEFPGKVCGDFCPTCKQMGVGECGKDSCECADTRAK